METSSTRNLAGHLDNLRKLTQGIQSLPISLEQTLDQVETELDIADPVDRASAKAIREAYFSLLEACGIRLDGEVTEDQLVDAEANLADQLNEQHGQVLEQLQRMFQFAPKLQELSSAALGTIISEDANMLTPPETNSSAQFTLDISSELELTTAYMGKGNITQWMTRAKPSNKALANYHFVEVQNSNDASSKSALVNLLSTMTGTEKKSFVSDQVRLAEAKADKLIQQFFYARIGALRSRSVTDDQINRCDVEFDMKIDQNIYNTLNHRVVIKHEDKHKTLRRLCFNQMIIPQYRDCQADLETAIVDLRLVQYMDKALVTTSSVDELTVMLNSFDDQKSQLKQQLFRPVAADPVINLNEINLNDLRDFLFLDE
ncbi:MAG: hypothetical protein HOA17_04605 [Candidatus Melainabacteria bacterium]|nr:hypothetical protein [Candidatus Melainabacteria bacterium]